MEELVRILDRDLRLIAPVDWDRPQPGDEPLPEPAYQLTHDYLVPSIRAWLDRRRRGTLRGRAELRLEACAELWSRRPEPRLLPSSWEYGWLRCLTRPSRWTESQRSMMTAAHNRSARWALASFVIAAVVVLATIQITGRITAQRLHDQIMIADTDDVVATVDHIGRWRRWLEPRLLTTASQGETPVHQLHASIALAELDRQHLPLLTAKVAAVPRKSLLPVRRSLQKYQTGVTQSLWESFASAKSEGERLRLGATLAELDPQSQRWNEPTWRPATDALVFDLCSQTSDLSFWIQAFTPVKSQLKSRLVELFLDQDAKRTDRFASAMVIRSFYEKDEARLAELYLEGNREQADVLLPAIEASGSAAAEVLANVLAAATPRAREESNSNSPPRRRTGSKTPRSRRRNGRGRVCLLPDATAERTARTDRAAASIGLSPHAAATVSARRDDPGSRGLDPRRA